MTTNDASRDGSGLCEGLGPLLDSEEDPARLWAEIHRLRAEVAGPPGYASWQDAATEERLRRRDAERLAHERLDPLRAELHAVNERYMTLLKMVADNCAVLKPPPMLLVCPSGKCADPARECFGSGCLYGPNVRAKPTGAASAVTGRPCARG